MTPKFKRRTTLTDLIPKETQESPKNITLFLIKKNLAVFEYRADTPQKKEKNRKKLSKVATREKLTVATKYI